MMMIDTVYNMDCLEGMKGMEQDSVDCIITSPPYYNAKEYSQWRTYEDYRQHLLKALHGMLTVLKPGHFCIINISCVLQPRKDRSDYSRRYAIPFHTMQLAEMMGFEFVDDIIWLKPEGAAVNRGQKFYHLRQPMTYHANSITEYVLVFRKPGRTPEEVSKEYSEEIKEASRVDDRYFQTNVWPINPVYDQAHPAIYPPHLVGELIRYYSFKGDTILDPYMGVGTTAIAAITIQRHFVGFEINEAYYREAARRINNEKAQLQLFT